MLKALDPKTGPIELETSLAPADKPKIKHKKIEIDNKVVYGA